MKDPAARWMSLMRGGDWASAWVLSDAALAARTEQDRTLPRHLQAIWDGTPLCGRRVLVRCYHGLGDTIQFVRLLPALQAIAREVTLWAQPALLPLLATLHDAPRLTPLHDAEPEGDHEVEIELMELAHALRITPETLPGATPWLHVPARRMAADDALAIGLVWRSGDWDPRRSVPLALLRPLAALPGVALHLLQRGPALNEAPPGFGIPSGCDDALETARRMRGLDLVISVDSMPAHLAGALGVPVWLLLPRPADWRWMEGRDDSPWYPTMRLFRQEAAGDWHAPIRRLLASLRALAKAKRSGFEA